MRFELMTSVCSDTTFEKIRDKQERKSKERMNNNFLRWFIATIYYYNGVKPSDKLLKSHLAILGQYE